MKAFAKERLKTKLLKVDCFKIFFRKVNYLTMKKRLSNAHFSAQLITWITAVIKILAPHTLKTTDLNICD